MAIELGKKYRDLITGFEGTATGYVVYISGCNQVLIVPRVGDDMKLVESAWFDEQRLVEVALAPVIRLDNSLSPGPDSPAPKR